MQLDAQARRTDSLTVESSSKLHTQSVLSGFGKYRDSLRDLEGAGERGLVSIVIPCYNCRGYVGAAIESALTQTYAPCEVIVIDDGSSDGSLEVIESFGPRIVWRAKANVGANAARNDGLELARGEFIQFLDGDDVLHPTAVAARMARFEDDVDAVFGDREWIDETGAPSGEYRRYLDFGWPPADLDAYLAASTSIQTSELLHRRDNLYRVGGFDEAIPKLQDTEFHLRLHLCGHRIRHLPEVVVQIRRHQGESRISNTDWYARDPLQIRNLAMHFLSLPPQFADRPPSEGLRAVACRMILGNSARARYNGDLRRALSLIAEARETCPDFPTTAHALDIGRVDRIIARCLGYWPMLRLNCLMRHPVFRVLRERLGSSRR